MTSGIYRIRNTVTGRFYVGSAVNIAKRIYEHFRQLRKGVHGNNRLQRAFSKYGEAAFEWSILEVVIDKQLLIVAEQRHIDALRPWFNICPTAGSQLGFRHSAESKERIRKIKTGFRHSEVTKLKMSASQTGRRHSQESIELIAASHRGAGNGMFGKSHDADALAKISAAAAARKDTPQTRAALALGHGWNKGKAWSEQARQRMSDAKVKKPVERMCLRTGEIVRYPSLRSVAADGFHVSHVSDCCKGRSHTHKGFRWNYGT